MEFSIKVQTPRTNKGRKSILVSWLPAKFKFNSKFWLDQRLCQPPYESKQAGLSWSSVQAETVRLQS